MVRRLVIFSLIALFLAAAAPPAPAQQKTPDPDEYRIGPEDVLDIVVWKNTDLTRTVPVRPDGKISLPLLNDVQAAGLSPLQLREVLVKRLAEYMPSPEVSVLVSDVKSFKISMLGEINSPGRHELRSKTTVLDAIALAGGFKPFAARSRVVVLRPEGRSMKRIPFNYDKVIAEGGEAENFFLQPGDVILVP